MTSVLLNGKEPELRIASYQALMRCPDDQTLKKIAKLLNSEEDEDVGEYIYSHLNNLKKTSDPHKQELAEAIKRSVLKSKVVAGVEDLDRWSYRSSTQIDIYYNSILFSQLIRLYACKVKMK